MLLVRRDAKLLIKAGRSGVDPTTISIHSVLHKRKIPDLQCFNVTGGPCSSWPDVDDYPSPGWIPIGHPSYREYYDIWRSSEKCYSTAADFPSAAILATCRTIAQEATILLYGENTLEFDLRTPNWSDQGRPLPETSLEYRASKVFSHDPLDWSSLPRPIRCSPLAAFLNAIGPRNSSNITSISFLGPNADHLSSCMALITALVASHLPNLQKLTISIDAADIQPDNCWSPDYWHPDPDSPFHAFWDNAGFYPPKRALDRFLGRVPSLKEFRYEGQTVLSIFGKDKGGYRAIKAMEEEVTKRAVLKGK